MKEKILSGLSKSQVLIASKQLTHALAFTCIAQFFIIITLGVISYKLTERREAHYFFATADSTKQVMNMQRIEKDMDGLEQLVLNQVRLYMIHRETVEYDAGANKQRDKFVRAYSSDEVWKAYSRHMSPKETNSFYAKLKGRNLVRLVKVRNVSVQQPGGSVQVDWDIYHYPDNTNIDWQYFEPKELLELMAEHRQYRSILSYDTENNQMYSEVAELNPLGIQITSVKTTGIEYTDEVHHD